jgi:hypothetical protein
MALLEVKDLTAAYGGIQALRGVSLKVEDRLWLSWAPMAPENPRCSSVSPP